MGLILKPSEIKSGAGQMRSRIESTRESYSGALQVVQNFSQNETLQSKAWDTVKSKIVEAHQHIVMGILAVQDVMEQDLSTLEENVDGLEDLYEDDLIMKIEQLTEECKRYEVMIKNLQTLQTYFVPSMYPNITKEIANYRILLEKTKEELELIKEKLLTLQEKARQTSELFQTVGILLNAIEDAINDAEVYISGTGQLSEGEWKTVISEAVQKIEEKNIYINYYFKNELGIVIDDFQKMYGEDTVNEIKSYLKEYSFEKLDDAKKQQINKYILEKACDCTSVSAENGKYQLCGVNGNIMYEMETNEIKDVVMNMAFANKEVKKEYIADYLRENLEISDMHIAAIMGNMQAESEFSPMISEKDFTDLYQPEYIELYSKKRENDGVGWGLIQWTYKSRKEGLLQFAIDKKGSSSFFGDMDTQLDYLIYEFENGECKKAYREFLKKENLYDATLYFREYIEKADEERDIVRLEAADDIMVNYFGE